jgi:soluble lytic murein transglycosylase
LPYQLNNAPLKIRDEAQDDLLRRHVGLRRARELYLLNRDWQARSEWRHVTSSLTKRELKTAALLAHRWDWHSQAITTLARTGYWDDLRIRFPLPYRGRVLTGADRQAIDPAWVYAIMRQESLFRPDVKSPAGALGLMQIMPATGRKIAGDLQLARPGDYAILRTDTNIRFGTYYLRYTLDRLQGNPMLATAAYNAGPRRVEQWLPERGKVEADIWAETIPFKETRKYVKRVMEFATVYHSLLEDDAAGAMKARMKPVNPAAGL